MKNTNLFQCLSDEDKTRRIKILGNDVDVKNYICSADGINYKKKPENIKLRMSICPTSYCNARCPFCIAKNTENNNKIDIKKLEKVLRLLEKEDRILCLTITGGEPFCDIALLNETIELVFEIFGFNLEMSLNTNGIGMRSLHKIKHLEKISTIHVSRHHYDDNINSELFGIEMPSTEELKEAVASVSYKDIFVFNCMLLKGYIDSAAEAHKYLDYALSLNVPKVSFITATPINKYASEHRIRFEDVICEDDESLLFTRGYNDFDFCHCRDGVYVSSNGEIIEFYGRTTADGAACKYCRGLVYGADNYLRNGFCGEILYGKD